MEAALEAVAQMENYGRKESELAGDLNVALPETLLSYRMQPVIEAFRRQAPNVRLSLQLSNCYLIREQVISGGIDIGIHYDVGGYGSSAVTERLSSYPLVLAASTGLSGKELNFTDRHQRKSSCLLTVDKNSIYHKLFARYLTDMDIVLNGEMEIGSVEAIKRCIQSNLGVAFLPRFTVEDELRQGMQPLWHTLLFIKSQYSSPKRLYPVSIPVQRFHFPVAVIRLDTHFLFHSRIVNQYRII